ncbi:MAG TPA: hypothetical protein VF503_11345 [Sphingobium sp.]|uniref:hypothetical protein n=1 Tax=Sphingobium sp. TaxID=1912891 RepID=UPI002ED64D6B
MTGPTPNDNAFRPRSGDRDTQLTPQDISDRMMEALPGALFVTGSMGLAALLVIGMQGVFG